MSRRHQVPYWFVPHGSLDPWAMNKGSTVKNLYLTLGGKRFLEQSSTVIFLLRLNEIRHFANLIYLAQK